MGWFLVGLLWFLGGLGLLVVDPTQYTFRVRVGVLLFWPFLVVLTVVMWFFMVISSRRVR